MSSHRYGPLAEQVEDVASSWSQRDGTARLWARDASLWTDSDESAWLGWLDSAAEVRARLPEWSALADTVRQDGIEDVVVLGMGGSSLCPEVLSQTFGQQAGYPRLRVLDSTVPAQIRALESELDLTRSLFVVSSKSGTTIEPDCLRAHFFAATQSALGSARSTGATGATGAAGAAGTSGPAGPAASAGRHFIAITDPGTPLEALASSHGFRHIAYGTPSIGGRFSALSPFGMLPAVLAGLDADGLLSRAEQMADACRRDATSGPGSNPGAELGIALAALARAGRDKLTLVTSPGLAALGIWLEQLIAESTGHAGQGIIPVAGEALGAAESYGADRFFVDCRLEGDTTGTGERDAFLAAAEQAGHPVVRLAVSDRLDLGAEFFRWEFATAVAGAILKLNPFVQPDVEAAKVAARQLTDEFAETRALPTAAARGIQSGVEVHCREDFALETGADLATTLASHFEQISPGDYFALNAFVAMSPRNQASLARIRQAVRPGSRAATMLGFGPRFLHSTGQLHKGGPNSGVFLQITADDADDLDIPERPFSFGVLKQAQALGDFRVLMERGRRALRLHLGPRVEDELERVADFAETAAQRAF